jgi:hypothetical protein
MMIKADAVRGIGEEVMEFLVTAAIADHGHRPASLLFVSTGLTSTGLTLSDVQQPEERLWI